MDMVERVATALDSAFEAEHNFSPDAMKRLARAAIEAMREPTQAMKSAGFLASPHDAGGCRDQFPSNKDWMEEAVISPYEAMIDAALKKA